jgi:hypothetical protein
MNENQKMKNLLPKDLIDEVDNEEKLANSLFDEKNQLFEEPSYEEEADKDKKEKVRYPFL